MRLSLAYRASGFDPVLGARKGVGEYRAPFLHALHPKAHRECPENDRRKVADGGGTVCGGTGSGATACGRTVDG